MLTPIEQNSHLFSYLGLISALSYLQFTLSISANINFLELRPLQNVVLIFAPKILISREQNYNSPSTTPFFTPQKIHL